MPDEIRPTGTLRAIGWPVTVVGVILLLGLFQYAWIGALVLAGGITLLVLAAKRDAGNRELVQRATLAQAARQQ